MSGCQVRHAKVAAHCMGWFFRALDTLWLQASFMLFCCLKESRTQCRLLLMICILLKGWVWDIFWNIIDVILFLNLALQLSFWLEWCLNIGGLLTLFFRVLGSFRKLNFKRMTFTSHRLKDYFVAHNWLNLLETISSKCNGRVKDLLGRNWSFWINLSLIGTKVRGAWDIERFFFIFFWLHVKLMLLRCLDAFLFHDHHRLADHRLALV